MNPAVITLTKIMYSSSELMKMIGIKKTVFYRDLAPFWKQLKKKPKTKWNLHQVRMVLQIFAMEYIIVM